MAEIVGKYVSNSSSFLDLGCGEITTLSHLVKRISGLASSTRAIDISLSRLLCGLEYAKEHMGLGFQNLSVAAAELQHIPLAGKSIDVSISNHALEPNGGDERRILGEIFRVTRGLCILFEPNFEAASAVAQERMTSLGYVKT
ncbi:MAG: methyltransferase domain-containing protein [Alphaproteobacteria bacterium]|nr:methyltransferase domain-containing protein [Alphaproteobacteria bacterium]